MCSGFLNKLAELPVSHHPTEHEKPDINSNKIYQGLVHLNLIRNSDFYRRCKKDNTVVCYVLLTVDRTSYDTDLTTAGQEKETRLFPWMRETGVGLSNNNR